jgi:RNA polymerase sigma factor (sigma-70 family)
VARNGGGTLDRRSPDPNWPARARGSLPDHQLVALVRRGEHSAFATLAARYERRLLSFCQQILGSREDAEDALQDVFASAYNAMLADERELHLKPWLYQIARHRCINQLRRRSTIGVDTMDDHCAENGMTLVEVAATRQDFRDLVSDVKGLPNAQRTALLLREIDGFTYQRIAVAMDTTVPAVKSLLVRARVDLISSASARDGTPAERDAAARPPRRRREGREFAYEVVRAAASAAA